MHKMALTEIHQLGRAGVRRPNKNAVNILKLNNTFAVYARYVHIYICEMLKMALVASQVQSRLANKFRQKLALH